MSTAQPCYLAEWYRAAAARESLERALAVLEASRPGPAVRLMFLIAVPTDEMLLGVFRAESADVVSALCEHAGLPIDRLTAATDMGLMMSS
ncbi:hypothetical protein FK535_26445 [Mycolicibacterium sp. 018/SC-01/001]|uniref:hypothetical protein n=1 Tax=Mycolicibacterium sp. 018/SC-01/001 TaxID=2592069 RepID=UPI00117DB8EC|nr:hypothetical protein [Mycolicibacterium sp. 018/SC-01/001]TRW77838.1 hypothetical protein FK535_26445 [Mycolicibacterium sp. 018/SC-01/001]